jgi:uncharacterized integral membrane protein
MKRFITWLVLLPIIVVIAAFAFRNAQLVPLDLFVFEINLPLAAVILIALFIGAGVGYLASIFVLLAHKKQIRQLKKQHQTLSSLSEVLKDK